LVRAASAPGVDLVLSAVVGAVGLKPLLAALRAGKDVALANKEALIVAGEIVMATARRYGGRIIPVDSEHSAMFQCLSGPHVPGARDSPAHLTASGGAFYRRKGSLSTVGVEEALKHPTWKMGKKITIDCATLTNKGLEAIEAHHLFGVPLEKIQIVIHPSIDCSFFGGV
jgi:1-deoxy-D-xylulose-5-phosphate reductoisomerase